MKTLPGSADDETMSVDEGSSDEADALLGEVDEELARDDGADTPTGSKRKRFNE